MRVSWDEGSVWRAILTPYRLPGEGSLANECRAHGRVREGRQGREFLGFRKEAVGNQGLSGSHSRQLPRCSRRRLMGSSGPGLAVRLGWPLY